MILFADAQSDPGLLCPHVPGDTFSLGVAQTAVIIFLFIGI